jgi:type IV fimbrial biogenesis protein FimT
MHRNERTNGVQSGECRGMTVLELLIVLAAVAVVVLISVPGSNMLLEKHRISSASSQLSGSLELALLEAHKRSSTVRVCPSSNGSTCRTDGNWNLGWLVYSDGNGNDSVEDIEIIRAYKAPHQKITISADGAVKSSASFTSAGLNVDQDARAGSFRICLKGSDSTPTVVKVDAEGWVQRMSGQNGLCGQG